MRSALLPIVESIRPDTSRHVAADANRLRHTRDLPNDAVSVHVGLRRQISDRDRAVQARGHPPGKVEVVLQRLPALCPVRPLVALARRAGGPVDNGGPHAGGGVAASLRVRGSRTVGISPGAVPSLTSTPMTSHGNGSALPCSDSPARFVGQAGHRLAPRWALNYGPGRSRSCVTKGTPNLAVIERRRHDVLARVDGVKCLGPSYAERADVEMFLRLVDLVGWDAAQAFGEQEQPPSTGGQRSLRKQKHAAGLPMKGVAEHFNRWAVSNVRGQASQPADGSIATGKKNQWPAMHMDCVISRGPSVDSMMAPPGQVAGSPHRLSGHRVHIRPLSGPTSLGN
jgi:hypothetical protein